MENLVWTAATRSRAGSAECSARGVQGGPEGAGCDAGSGTLTRFDGLARVAAVSSSSPESAEAQVRSGLRRGCPVSAKPSTAVQFRSPPRVKVLVTGTSVVRDRFRVDRGVDRLGRDKPLPKRLFGGRAQPGESCASPRWSSPDAGSGIVRSDRRGSCLLPGPAIGSSGWRWPGWFTWGAGAFMPRDTRLPVGVEPVADVAL